jgi:hypothetical protein
MSIKGGTTREMMLKKIVEDEEIEDKKQDSHKGHHGSTHHKTRKNKMDSDRAEAERKAKEKEKEKGKQGTPEDIKQMDKQTVDDLGYAVNQAQKQGKPTVDFKGKTYEVSKAITSAIEARSQELKQGGGGGSKYTVAYTKWVEQQFQKDIKAGTPIAKIQADAKVQQSYQKTSGQSPIAK